jgi:hypothetical protein
MSFASACAVSVWACSGASPPSSQAPDEAAPAEVGETPPVAAPHGKRAPCGSDQACNDDPSVSALWGRCLTSGVCECNEGFERSPTSDLCRPVDVE